MKHLATPLFLSASLVILLHGQQPPASPPRDADFVRQAYDTYTSMAQASPSRGVAWQYLGPTNISGRATDVAVADVGAVRRIYAAVGRELTPEAEAAMEAHLADQVQGKYGHHTYSLAEFGLERGPIDERLARYWDRFDVPRERA